MQLKMAKTSTLVLLFINISTVFMFRHQKPVAKQLWPEYCEKNMVALNDCNWCWCNNQHQYACKARVCSEVDMFGHFNDAIREVDVGMEGHGVWRSRGTPCEPGVHYKRSALLCVCTANGTWPNPVCRDIFQVLHAVEVTQYARPSEDQSCTPSKLHLIGCNVCICPPYGTINPKYCTKRNCNEDAEEPPQEIHEDHMDEIYATCNPDRKYKLGCKSCVCLRNNRLLCDNCTAETRQYLRRRESLCSGKGPNKVFKVDCNHCFCDANDVIMCTVKGCIKNVGKNTIKLKFPLGEHSVKKFVEPPANDEDCIPGTSFKRDCNTCFCMLYNGIKNVGCTLKGCGPRIPFRLGTDCVVGTAYEVNCLKCYCYKENGVKREVCRKDKKCDNDASGLIKDFKSIRGYCEPLHTYRKDCNKCKCLADGKTISCTSRICPLKPRAGPIITELLPIVQQHADCPEGHSYKVDCNDCFCMKNGNALCTQNKCK